MTAAPRMGYEFNIGDRVEVVKEFYNYELIPVGTTGTVTETRWLPGQISRTSHATSNGGGYDLHVRLDDGRAVVVRAEGHITYIERIDR